MTDSVSRFAGTKSYVATDDLKVAVNAAVLLRRPLPVKGEQDVLLFERLAFMAWRGGQ